MKEHNNNKNDPNKIVSFLEKNFRDILIYLICWSIGGYMLRVSAIRINLDSTKDIDNILLFMLIFSIGLILLPFMKSIKIGKIIELEREVKETKKELKETRTEFQQSISMVLTTINTSINSLNNSINISIPGVEDMKREVKKLQSQKKTISSNSLEQELDELIENNEGDLNFALAKTRMEIEKLIRRILRKRTSVDESTNPDIKFLTLTKLFRLLIEEYPMFKKYYNSFRYVQQVCNAAIHGQKVSYGQAEEALHLGIILINELKEVAGNAPNNG